MQETSIQHSGFWRRLCALGIDVAIMYALAISLDFIFPPTPLFKIASLVLGVGLGAFYYIGFLTKYSRTPGKMAMGLMVITEELDAVDLPRAFKRHAVEIFLATLSLSVSWKTFSKMSPEELRLASNFFSAWANREALAQYPHVTSAGEWISVVASGLYSLASLVCMYRNPMRKTIHDYLAGTMVIHPQKSEAYGNRA